MIAIAVIDWLRLSSAISGPGSFLFRSLFERTCKTARERFIRPLRIYDARLAGREAKSFGPMGVSAECALAPRYADCVTLRNRADSPAST